MLQQDIMTRFHTYVQLHTYTKGSALQEFSVIYKQVTTVHHYWQRFAAAEFLNHSQCTFMQMAH